MGLIFDNTIRMGEWSIGDALNIYITIFKDVLSMPYNLDTECVVMGTLLDIDDDEDISEGGKNILDKLIGMKIKFILFKSMRGEFDHLYIHNDSWNILRDYGIFDAVMRINIIEAIEKGERIKIYPERDKYI